MKKVLFVNSCISAGGRSRTELLCRELLKKYDSDDVTEIDVTKNTIRPLDLESLTMRNKLVDQGKLQHPMFDLAKEFAAADIIIVGAPYWDLSFPAQLKAYIEQIMVTNIAFGYTEEGSKGLCKAEELIYVTTSGGYIEESDFGYDYMKGIAKMTGIGQTRCFRAEGLDIQGNDTQLILKEALDKIRA